ncbi:hypothetical protein XW59_019705 [Aquamicrobium sp. LC103]|nr:hypothetical protein XW59_019705 [Aquamicrobium sp. LC103]
MLLAFVLPAALFLLLAACLPARAVSADAVLADRPPKLLSEFGFFDDMRTQKPAAGVVPFAPHTALFSDGALKYRFVHVPEGKAATFVADEAFEFPAGSALVKTFAFPSDYRAPGKDVRLIETRVMLRHEDGWHAWAYLWNEEQTDAELKIAGARVDISTIDEEGEPLAFSYSVPNKNQCKGCHAFSGEIVPLGPKARNLNFDFDYPGGTRNQLEHWKEAGILEGLPDPSTVAFVPDWQDEGADIDARARAWLDVNCAHCHRREGPASNSGLFLTWGEKSATALGIRKRPVAAGRGSGGRQFDIKPGDPDGSILNYRVESTEPGIMMPELGRGLEDRKAAEMLRQWVSQLR